MHMFDPSVPSKMVVNNSWSSMPEIAQRSF